MEAYRPLFSHLFPGLDVDGLTHPRWLRYKEFADAWRAGHDGV